MNMTMRTRPRDNRAGIRILEYSKTRPFSSSSYSLFSGLVVVTLNFMKAILKKIAGFAKLSHEHGIDWGLQNSPPYRANKIGPGVDFALTFLVIENKYMNKSEIVHILFTI